MSFSGSKSVTLIHFFVYSPTHCLHLGLETKERGITLVPMLVGLKYTKPLSGVLKLQKYKSLF